MLPLYHLPFKYAHSARFGHFFPPKNPFSRIHRFSFETFTQSTMQPLRMADPKECTRGANAALASLMQVPGFVFVSSKVCRSFPVIFTSVVRMKRNMDRLLHQTRVQSVGTHGSNSGKKIASSAAG